MTRMINAWVYDTPIKDIALKALHVMPNLLLQKARKNSKRTLRRGKSISRSAKNSWISK